MATRALILLLFFCGAAEVQTTAGDEIRKVVKPGQHLGVTDQGGQEVKGRVVDLGLDSFAIQTRGQRRDLRYADTVRIVIRVPETTSRPLWWRADSVLRWAPGSTR